MWKGLFDKKAIWHQVLDFTHANVGIWLMLMYLVRAYCDLAHAYCDLAHAHSDLAHAYSSLYPIPT